MTEDVRLRVADAVRAEMHRRRRTQQDLAQLLGISQTQISRRLDGTIAFRAHEIVQIAELLDVDAAALLGQAAGSPA